MSESDETLVDAHVHYHTCFRRSDFLAAAASNFRRFRTRLGLEGNSSGCLMLTESVGCHFFERFRDAARFGRESAWSAKVTDDDNALWVRPAGGAGVGRGHEGTALLIVAGRQVVTAEGLEVLALGQANDLEEHRDLRTTIDNVHAAGAVPVVPWGFGKWWFRRGRLIAQLLGEDLPGRFFLGDNGGRPASSRRPELFEVAARRGIWVLPGSDPLPFPAQVDNVGGCGFVIPNRIDRDRPATAVLDWLRGSEGQPQVFGSLESLPRFVRYQLAMQWRKRRGLGSDPEVRAR